MRATVPGLEHAEQSKGLGIRNVGGLSMVRSLRLKEDPGTQRAPKQEEGAGAGPIVGRGWLDLVVASASKKDAGTATSSP